MVRAEGEAELVARHFTQNKIAIAELISGLRE